MRGGVPLSVLFHVALLVIAVVGLPAPKLAPVDVAQPVPIEIVEIDEFTRITRAPEPEAPPAPPEPEPEPEPQEAPEPEPEPVVEPTPPAPATPPAEPTSPPPAPEPEPVPAPEPEPAPVPEPEPEPEPQEKVNVAPPTPPAPKLRPTPPRRPKRDQKPAFDPGRIAALLDKLPEERQPTPPPQPAPSQQAPQQSRIGAQTSLSISELDALRQQISACWSPPVGATNAADLVVTLMIWLNPDGSLARAPQVKGGAFALSSYQRAAQDAALRAVRRCAPYRLPVNKYASWREIELRFDPSRMFGG